MAVCKLCGTVVQNLARSHLLPRAMTRFMAGQSNVAVTMKLEGGATVSPAPGGAYSDTIICATCEASFAMADNHFIVFWRSLVAGQAAPHFPFPTLSYREYRAVPELLHQFVATTLVRAHLSGAAAVTGFSLEGWGDGLVSAAKAGTDTIDQGPQVALRFVKSPKACYTMLPYPVFEHGRRHFEVVFPHLRASVAEGSALLPAFLQPFVLRRNRPATVLHTNFLTPNELEPIERIRAPNVARWARLTEVLSRKQGVTWSWK